MKKEWKKNIPILLLSAYCNYYDSEKANEAGAASCLMKPLRVPHLMDAITKAI